MSQDLQSNTLLLVTDTSISQEGDTFYGFEPVVREIEYFLTIFKSVHWIGFEDSEIFSDKPFATIDTNRVSITFLPKTGGKSLLRKIDIVKWYYNVFKIIFKNIDSYKYIHVRGPSHPSVIAALYNLIYQKSNKRFWFKYAGTWMDNAPMFYRFQRELLRIIPKKNIITINGDYEKDKSNFLNFQNPCLTEKESLIDIRKFSNRSGFLFVGNLNASKGVDLLISTFKNSESNIIFIGGGSNFKNYQQQTEEYKNIQFLGHKSKLDVTNYMSKSSALILPSKSEGFPKVISEAMNFGCIPIVSNISCISEIISHKSNGYLLDSLTSKSVNESINWLETLCFADLENIRIRNKSMVNIFTYEYYVNRIQNEVFND